MSGVFGFALKQGLNIPVCFIREAMYELFLLSGTRGKDTAGALSYAKGELLSCKDAVSVRVLLKTRAYKDFCQASINRMLPPGNGIIPASAVFIGCTGLAVNDSQMCVNNIQPVIEACLSGVHDGVIAANPVLDDAFFPASGKEFPGNKGIFGFLRRLIEQGLTPREAIAKLYENIEGSASIAVLMIKDNSLILGTNTGSLYYCAGASKGFYLFASERPILEKFIKRLRSRCYAGECAISQVKAKTALYLRLDDFGESIFSIGRKLLSHQAIRYDAGSYFRQLLDKGESDEQQAECHAIRRCAKCVLPETIPFIRFDDNGVCNYCLTHKKIIYKGSAALEDVVSRYRRSDGRPDCLVALSGGRDSAFALHYVKTVLKMNPVAFTFDWGMTSDFAYRNQARLTGKLGVEHIVISADLRVQRRYIRQNINAWFKRPHPGMVVLFMAGDKPAEYYIKKTAKEYGIGLVVMARGNEFENTDFKWGFLGIPAGEPQGVIHNLSFPGRMRFSLSSVKQFMLNPAYFNSSVWSTLFGYWATYILVYDYLYLWHYIPWDEAEVITTLKNEYAWESAQDTIQTWRIDDLTSPFYNFIYYTLGGFTENDAFRSNQIREGVLSRQDALNLVLAENRPRLQAIKDYLNKVGLDYDEVIEKIQSIPKLPVTPCRGGNSMPMDIILKKSPLKSTRRSP
ncbi:MAG: hypothetical protein WC487_04310 [Candidatus Omnitrophota bacterium]